MVALSVTCIYLLLAGVHIYWALGGRLAGYAGLFPAVPGVVRRPGVRGDPPALSVAALPAAVRAVRTVSQNPRLQNEVERLTMPCIRGRALPPRPIGRARRATKNGR